MQLIKDGKIYQIPFAVEAISSPISPEAWLDKQLAAGTIEPIGVAEPEVTAPVTAQEE